MDRTLEHQIDEALQRLRMRYELLDTLGVSNGSVAATCIAARVQPSSSQSSFRSRLAVITPPPGGNFFQSTTLESPRKLKRTHVSPILSEKIDCFFPQLQTPDFSDKLSLMVNVGEDCVTAPEAAAEIKKPVRSQKCRVGDETCGKQRLEPCASASATNGSRFATAIAAEVHAVESSPRCQVPSAAAEPPLSGQRSTPVEINGADTFLHQALTSPSPPRTPPSKTAAQAAAPGSGSMPRAPVGRSASQCHCWCHAAHRSGKKPPLSSARLPTRSPIAVLSSCESSLENREARRIVKCAAACVKALSTQEGFHGGTSLQRSRPWRPLIQQAEQNSGRRLSTIDQLWSAISDHYNSLHRKSTEESTIPELAASKGESANDK